MSFNTLPVDTAEVRIFTIAELMAWLKHSGYTDKMPISEQPNTPQIVERQESPEASLRYAPIKGL